MISTWSIRHPIPVVVLFLALTLLGLWGFRALRVNGFPDIDIPVVTVTVLQPGAAPTELETQVTRKVEDTVAGLGNVKHLRSIVSEGVSTTSIEFTLGIDVDRATNDVRDAVAKIQTALPGDAEEPIVQRVDLASGPFVTYVVAAPAMAPEALSWFVDDEITKALLAVKGVSQVSRIGGVEREIRIRLDPDRLMALGVTAGEVSAELATVNTNLPGGRATLGDRERSIRTLGTQLDLEHLAATRVSLPDGRVARLSELGEVSDQYGEPRQQARLDGQPVVAFEVARTVGASEVQTAELVQAAVEGLVAVNPGVAITRLVSTVDFIEDSYEASLEALLLGALLAMGVVWWFLRDWRATIVSAIAMPLSLLPAFGIMAALDYSLNVVTLLALSLVVGILVDDAIVEVENIVRHMGMGKTARQAATDAAAEIALAVIATTATILAVFAPVGFMPGVAGQFFQAFALAACVAVFFSLVVARMLTPLMGAVMMRAHDGPARQPGWLRPYLGVLAWALRHRGLTLLAGLLFFAGSIGLAMLLPGDFIPATDNGRSSLAIELAPGATLAQTDAAAQDVTRILLARPEVESVFAAVGSATHGGGPGGQSSSGEVRKATINVDLVPKAKRALSQADFERAVGPELQAIAGLRVRFGADGSSGSKLGITLAGDDSALLDATVTRLVNEMRGVESLANVASTASLARPEILIRPLPDKAAALGVSAQMLAYAVRVATLGDIDERLAKFDLPDRQIPIRVSLNERARDDLDVLRNLHVVTMAGQSVPLRAVAEIGFGSGPAQLNRLDRRRSAAVEAELGGMPLGVAVAAVAALPTMQNLPHGIVQLPSGDAEDMAELAGGFVTAMLVGVLMVYTVLVLLFGGFLQPLTILTALPLAIGGAMGMLLVAGMSLSMPALIGLIMLLGVAAKNSILLVEYAMNELGRGVPRVEAIMDAATKRARPIVMTTVAMGAGMLPIALGLGADAEFRAPMAVAVIGGLISSTVLSLVFVPVVFTLMDAFQARLGRLRRPRQAPGLNAAATPAE